MPVKKRVCRRLLVLLCTSLSFTVPAQAFEFEFVNVGDVGTPIPDGTGTFVLLQLPAISGDIVAYRGFGGSDQDGIYKRNVFQGDTTLVTVADRTTPVPGRIATTFSIFKPPSLHNGDIAFRGTASDGGIGVYTVIGGVLDIVADTNTLLPVGIGYFIDFGLPWIYDGKVVFRGFGNDGQSGIYTNFAGGLTAVVDTTTMIPGGVGSFVDFGFAKPGVEPSPTSLPTSTLTFDDDKFVFFGSGSDDQEGVYLAQAGTVTKIADLGTPIPSGVGNFTNLNPSRIAAQIEEDTVFGDKPGVRSVIRCRHTFCREVRFWRVS